MIQEIPSRSRQANPSRQAREQLRAELRLELLDVSRQSGLGNPDLVRRACDASFIGDLDEILDAAQFHGRQGLRTVSNLTITNRHVLSQDLLGVAPKQPLLPSGEPQWHTEIVCQA